MIVDRVDPRDIEEEVDEPAFRVSFWHQPDAPPGVAQELVMFHSDEYRLSDVADGGEVLAWARGRARADQTFTLWVEHRNGDRLGLIQLMGSDPTRAE